MYTTLPVSSLFMRVSCDSIIHNILFIATWTQPKCLITTDKFVSKMQYNHRILYSNENKVRRHFQT